MLFIKKKSMQLIVADEGKQLRKKDDVYIPEHEENGITIPEVKPTYSDFMFVPTDTTEETINELFIEEDIPEEEINNDN